MASTRELLVLGFIWSSEMTILQERVKMWNNKNSEETAEI